MEEHVTGAVPEATALRHSSGTRPVDAATGIDTEQHRRQLIEILQNAFSGELAAALAYRGHWKTLRDPEQRASVQRIEMEEWEHRREVGRMLDMLDAAPRQDLEVRRRLIGWTIAVGCRFVGWFIPMYFAGRLESGNAAEYVHAAGHAVALGMEPQAEMLSGMALVEEEHEIFFRSLIRDHPMLPRMKRLFGWG